MKFEFAALTKKGEIKKFERQLDKLKDDEVLLKQMACNICTTDYQQWQGKREHQGYPMAGGHEASAVVVEVGDKVKSFIPGDHVAIIYDYCGECDSCKSGYITNCENIKQFGKNYSKEFYGIFGFSNYFKRKSKSLVKIDKKLDFSEAAFVEPLSSVISGIEKLNPFYNETIVVIGSGTMGILNAQVAKAYGFNVILSGTNEKKNIIASQMGLTVINPKEDDVVKKVKDLNNGKLADSVIVAAGSSSANKQALEISKNYDAKILFYAAGYPKPELDIDSNDIHYRRLNLVGAYGSKLYDFNKASNLLSSGKIDVSKLVEQKYDFSDIDEAFKKASQKNSFRVSVILNKE
ncbi:MAG: alcohol dehydrogenase catalytic domain-containing protein [Tissierellia bacterium]|nr:alcohol dehydrogenase catalytic domain-containing protein [Tissierellia bacterium]